MATVRQRLGLGGRNKSIIKQAHQRARAENFAISFVRRGPSEIRSLVQQLELRRPVAGISPSSVPLEETELLTYCMIQNFGAKESNFLNRKIY
jgi:hypothetical protein